MDRYRVIYTASIENQITWQTYPPTNQIQLSKVVFRDKYLRFILIIKVFFRFESSNDCCLCDKISPSTYALF
jgi:hypothetical protein